MTTEPKPINNETGEIAMKEIYVNTQTELDKALIERKDDDVIICRGAGSFEIWGSATVWASGSATVWASGSATVWASGSATVRAWGSATVQASGSATVQAWDSATVRASGSATVWASGGATVRASGSATVRASGSATVRAWDSATVRAWGSATVRAWDSATVRASGSATVWASKFNAVTITGKKVKCVGGVIIKIPEIKTAKQWCDFYGVPIVRGVAVLYKTVRADYKSSQGFLYAPNSTPAAPDWDGGKAECGGGLHFSPQPFHALEFDNEGVKFMACPILVKEIAIHKNPIYPKKVKAPRVYKPCYEVDVDGKRIEAHP